MMVIYKPPTFTFGRPDKRYMMNTSTDAFMYSDQAPEAAVDNRGL